MDISVVIVTYNSARCIANCLQSVLKQRGVNFEVIVVDNASADETVRLVQSFPVRLVASKENLGFGRGCNLGFAGSSGRFVFLLNPDAWLEEEDSMAKMIGAFDAHDRWGIAGTRVLDAATGHEVQPAWDYPGQRHVSQDFSGLPGRIAWIIGASMMARRDVFEKLGGFDPAFFLYSEETDLCLRVRKLGFEIGFIPEVAVRHIGGDSEDRRDPYSVSARKLKGLLLFRQKHYPFGDCVRLARRDLRRARFRSVWNALLGRMQPARSKAWQKSRNYRAVWEISRDYLSSVNK
jgi:N-acetylglucosaminyl-diphospho-decaprenol L-rhamnosyltransferase